jgi:hypothetical protein
MSLKKASNWRLFPSLFFASGSGNLSMTKRLRIWTYEKLGREKGIRLGLRRPHMVPTTRVSASKAKASPDWSAQTTLRSPSGKQCIPHSSLASESPALKL